MEQMEYLCTRKSARIRLYGLLLMLQRGVAQSGSAPGLGPGGRRFESCRPDKYANAMCCFQHVAFFLVSSGSLP